MNWSRSILYVAPFLGAVVFSASVGAAVIGGYGAVQEEFGLCDSPIVSVTPPDDAEEFTNDTRGPSLTRLDYDDLTPAERRAFEETVSRVRNQAEVNGRFAHEEAFEGGAVVVYQGHEYYVTVESMNDCVSVSSLVFPLGMVGVVVGFALFLTPALSRRRAIRRRDGARTDGPAAWLRTGPFADASVVVAFAVGLALALLPTFAAVLVDVPVRPLQFVGVAAGAAVVGAVANSVRRAGVLGVYFGAIAATALLGTALWFALPVGAGGGFPGRQIDFVVAVAVATAAAATTRRLG